MQTTSTHTPKTLPRLTKKYPLLASLTIILILTLLTETPIPILRQTFAPLTGIFYGDYLTDLLLNALGAAILLLAAGTLGMKGNLGLKRPRPWHTIFLGWPLLLLALLMGSEHFSGDTALTFDPILLLIFLGLYLAIGFFEELLFRGCVQGLILRKWGTSYKGILISILLSNLVFGAAHLINLVMGRATPLYALTQFIYAFFFGIFFSALFLRSNSLLPGVALHLLHNLIVNLDAFTPGAIPRSEIIKTATPESALIGILITLPLFLIGVLYLRRSKIQPLSVDTNFQDRSV